MASQNTVRRVFNNSCHCKREIRQKDADEVWPLGAAREEWKGERRPIKGKAE